MVGAVSVAEVGQQQPVFGAVPVQGQGDGRLAARDGQPGGRKERQPTNLRGGPQVQGVPDAAIGTAADDPVVVVDEQAGGVERPHFAQRPDAQRDPRQKEHPAQSLPEGEGICGSNEPPAAAINTTRCAASHR